MGLRFMKETNVIFKFKKVYLLISIFIIFFVIGNGISIYKTSIEKKSNWRKFIILLQEINLPDRNRIIKADIDDRIGVPFKITIIYKSPNTIEKEGQKYKHLVEKIYFMKEDPHNPYSFHTFDRLLHFHLTKNEDNIYQIKLVNGKQ